MTDEKTEEVITKRRVTMRNVNFDPKTGLTQTETAVDYVPDDERGLLEPYLADARQRWQYIEVSEEFDAGPGGYHGQTSVSPLLDHPEAGAVYEATTPTTQEK